MKKLTVLLFGALLFAASAVSAETPSTAAGSIEFGIGKIFSYQRTWNDDITLDKFGMGTQGNGFMTAPIDNEDMMFVTLLFPTPVFSVSYFVIDVLALGFQGGYNYIKIDESDDPMHMYFVGPEVKFYVDVTESILVDAHGSFTYSGYSVDTND